MATLPGQHELEEIRGNYLAQGELKVGYSHRFASHRLGLDFYKAILDFACGTSHRIWTVCGGKSSGKLCSRFVILPGLFLSLHMYFRFAVLLLFIILTYNYSLESFVRKSNQQEGLGDCRTRVKGFALHRTIMTLTGESEEVNNSEERIIELKREKRNRKTAVTKTHHNVERLSTSGEDPELIQNGVDTLWKVLEACLAVMDELQKAYLHLRDNDSKKSVVEVSRSFGERNKQCYRKG